MSMDVAYKEYSVPLLKEGKAPLPFEEWLQTVPEDTQLAYNAYVNYTLTNGKNELPLRFDVWRAHVYPKGRAYFVTDYNAETIRDNQQFGYKPQRKNQVLK